MEGDAFEHIGYIKFSGEAVPDGVIDAASAGSALLGLDDALRFFNSQQAPELRNAAYDIPVTTKRGSWVAVVVATVAAVPAAFALSYAKKAGEKLAENDFKDIGLGDILKKSMGALQSLVKLIKHTRRPRGWEGLSITNDADQPLVSILNDRGEQILIPLEYFKWYQSLPSGLLARLTSAVRRDRVLSISTKNDQEIVEVYEDEKPLFTDASDEEIEEFLFPELLHGMRVRLEGRLIRGNEASNSIGLEYMGHILNCVPERGSIRRFKPALFLTCIVEGEITRFSKSRFVAERRPTIIVRTVIPREADPHGDLFDS